MPGWPVEPLTGASIVGDMSIRVSSGASRPSLMIQRRFTIFWGFDANGKLIEVYVWVTHRIYS